ncbi:MAG: DNA-3-methyladenine glycosylase 2 family protein [Cyanobacteria bacterium P01_F01_bin.150]
MMQRLSPESFSQGIQELSDRDPDLAHIVEQYGPPPLWERSPGFPTLLKIILEQQVSLSSAKAAYERLEEAIAPVTPERFLELSDAELKAIGFSRQKARYGRELSNVILAGTLRLEDLEQQSDVAVRMALMQVTGIGVWTSTIYLLMALGRLDVWPTGDIALHSAIQQAKGLDKRPTSEEARVISLEWQPWRAVAARILWHLYLSQKGRNYS